MASIRGISMARMLAGVGLVLVGCAAQAGSDAALNCQADKVTAAGIRAACLAGEQAKALQGGKANPVNCEDTFDAALAKADKDAAKKGVTCRYLDNQDGTISDLNTLLMWEKKVAQTASVHDYQDQYTWSDAFEWAASLGQPPTTYDPTPALGNFAGRTDWRLPTISELITIWMDTSIGNDPQNSCIFGTSDSPCIDPIFRSGDSFTAGGYWSSTTFEETPTSAWMIDFSNGVVSQFSKEPNSGSPGTRYVRAVRGGR